MSAATTQLAAEGGSRDFSFCSVPVPGLIYAGPRTREEFDRIPLEPKTFDWAVCSTLTLIKSDGQQWERRATVKCLGDHSPGGVTVIFQWFDERPLALNEGGAL